MGYSRFTSGLERRGTVRLPYNCECLFEDRRDVQNGLRAIQAIHYMIAVDDRDVTSDRPGVVDESVDSIMRLSRKGAIRP